MTIGALLFYFQSSSMFPNIAQTPVWKLLLVWLIGCTLLPLPLSMDIRGRTEMHPLNGPAWSLFVEYIANILHALVLRKLPLMILGALTGIAALALIHLAVTSPNGDIIGGWSLEPEQLRIGFTRLLIPYMAGMLLRRAIKVKDGKRTFLASSLLLILILIMPRIGGYDQKWLNGVYESFAIILLFPIVIYLGAIGKVTSAAAEKLCTFLGDVSYPIYIIHFPLAYVFYAWVTNNKIPMATGLPVGISILVVSVLLSYLFLKLYDEPVRRWLTSRFLSKKSDPENGGSPLKVKI